MSRGVTSSYLPGRLLLHPVALAALALWMVNDHLFKALWPGHLVVGKLSDVASLIAFPLLVAAGVEWLAFLARRRPDVFPVLVGASLATAFVMATINVFPAAAHAYEVGLGALQWPFFAARSAWEGGAVPAIRPVQLWMDATDLLTLPAAAVPIWLGWRVRKQGSIGAPANTRYAHAP
jgi:hypothetical protein